MIIRSTFVRKNSLIVDEAGCSAFQFLFHRRAFVSRKLDRFNGVLVIGLALSRACISWCLDIFSR